jgi:hypothetical protein
VLLTERRFLPAMIDIKNVISHPSMRTLQGFDISTRALARQRYQLLISIPVACGRLDGLQRQ